LPELKIGFCAAAATTEICGSEDSFRIIDGSKFGFLAIDARTDGTTSVDIQLVN
jgi:hypothetical protein